MHVRSRRRSVAATSSHRDSDAPWTLWTRSLRFPREDRLAEGTLFHSCFLRRRVAVDLTCVDAKCVRVGREWASRRRRAAKANKKGTPAKTGALHRPAVSFIELQIL